MGCGCSHQLKDLRLSNASCTMGDSRKKLDFATATPASGADHATPLTSPLSAVDEQIEQSKAHWSTLTDHPIYTDEEEVDFKVSNLQEFQALQRHPTLGGFFANFTGDGISTGFDHGYEAELVMGQKFAEGAQAELYETQINWIDLRRVENDRREGYEYVLKVFKEGTLLKQVKSQLPQGFLQNYAQRKKHAMSPTPKVLPRYTSRIHFGVLLKSGRFAFFMQKHQFDLRTMIERNMKLRSGKHCGPFSKKVAEGTMYKVALGVEWLHIRDIVHRDLKASNVLVDEMGSGSKSIRYCFVADYECSVGVVGTNFFRAPEILQACKERKVNERPEVFSKAADVYSYGMTCYEILTRKLPFEDHPLSSSPLLIDLVINQHLRPKIPKYVDDWVRELLTGCWQFDPIARPGIGDILNVLSSNSREVRRSEVELKEVFGENFRGLY